VQGPAQAGDALRRGGTMQESEGDKNDGEGPWKSGGDEDVCGRESGFGAGCRRGEVTGPPNRTGEFPGTELTVIKKLV
jgi:hypothetical protein